MLELCWHRKLFGSPYSHFYDKIIYKIIDLLRRNIPVLIYMKSIGVNYIPLSCLVIENMVYNWLRFYEWNNRYYSTSAVIIQCCYNIVMNLLKMSQAKTICICLFIGVIQFEIIAGHVLKCSWVIVTEVRHCFNDLIV